MSGPLGKTTLWRRLDLPGLEYCAMGQEVDGWRIEGDVICAVDGVPMRVTYQVTCDGTWRTVSVEVLCTSGSETRVVALRRGEDGRWRHDGEEVTGVRGAVDADLGFSPSTNTLPIRRLGLNVGESRELTAAWVRFPDLTVLPLRQRYTRTGERTYRYESVESGFTADLTVDDVGLVIDYPGLWERVAQGAGGAPV